MYIDNDVALKILNLNTNEEKSSLFSAYRIFTFVDNILVFYEDEIILLTFDENDNLIELKRVRGELAPPMRFTNNMGI